MTNQYRTMVCSKMGRRLYLDAEAISFAAILITRRIELNERQSGRMIPSKLGKCYIVLPAFDVFLEYTGSDRCDASIVQKVTGEVFEEIY